MLKIVALYLALVSALFVASCDPVLALDAEYTQFTIMGKVYDVPIPNKETKQDFYFLHRAIDENDESARKLLLGGKKEKLFFIGDVDAVRWLVLREFDEDVIEHKNK